MAANKAAVDQLLASLQRDLNSCTDADRSLRRRAFDSLRKRLLDAPDAPDEATLTEALPALFPTLLRGFTDGVEKVREKSAELVNDLLARSADPASLLPSLMPALKATVGVVPVEEPSEEIRLGLVNLAKTAIVAAGERAEPFAEEVAAIVHASMRDQFHEVKKASCALAEALVAALLHPKDGHPSPSAIVTLARHAPKMINAALPDLGHRHSQVRHACLNCVDALFDFVSPGDVADALAPGVRQLCWDRTPAVRAAFHVALARWISVPRGMNSPGGVRGGIAGGTDREDVDDMLVDSPPDLPEGCGLPHARSLLPFLLSGVADEVEANGVNALALVESVGAANDAALNVEGEADGGSGEERGTRGWDPSPSEEAAATLPPPFAGRPSASARRLVRSLLPSLVRGALTEVREWTSGKRNAGARLLGTIVAFAEAAASRHLGDLMKEIVAAVGDDDRDTAERVVVAARVLGAHVSPSHWLPIALDHVVADKASPATRASALVILAAMLRVAPRGSLAGEPMRLLAAGLASAPVRGSMDHPAVRAQLSAALTNAVVGGGFACEPASGDLFRSFLQLRAAEGGTSGSEGSEDAGSNPGVVGGGGTGPSTGPGGLPPAETSAAARGIDDLARACGFSSAGELYSRHAEAILGQLAVEQDGWQGDGQGGQRTLGAFVLGAPPEVLRREMRSLCLILKCAMHRDREPALRLSLLRVLDAAFESRERGAAFEGVANEVVERMISESLIWKAGKTAAAVRYAAVVSLGTMLRNELCPRRDLLTAIQRGELLPQIGAALEEDYYADTRAAACHALAMLLERCGDRLTDEHRRYVYPELLKRMDDSRDEIRVTCAGVVAAFFRSMPRDYDETNVGYLLKGFLIHMDDPNPDVQEAVCRALEIAAEKKPDAVVEAVKAARDTHRGRVYLDRADAAAVAAKGGLGLGGQR
mmetsp:Transcript_5713/g.23486  ORF Transcript_5713/g.23486 Transcript_5713/m.23486 type:complete len:938 (-) Transcript_5713:210-3023(-)